MRAGKIAWMSVALLVAVMVGAQTTPSPPTNLVVSVGGALSINAISMPTGTVGVGYSVTFTASGGVPPRTWSVLSGTVPPGLTLNGSTGVLSGTPTAAGTSTFTIQVTDSRGGQATVTVH